jgi:hypothetical protein
LLRNKGYYYRIYVNQSGDFDYLRKGEDSNHPQAECGSDVIGEGGGFVGQE